MNERGIAPISKIDPSKLDKNNYADSLAAEAERVGIFTEADTARIRGELLGVLGDVIGYSSEGKSSSVTTDRAGQMAKSILYNIGTVLKSAPTPDAAARTMKEKPMKELYAEGYAINRKKWEEAKRLWGRVRYTRLRDGGEDYDKAIDKNIRIYLRDYDPRLSAHDKLYLTLPKFGIRGAFHIGGAVAVLNRLLEANTGRTGTVTDAEFREVGEEPRN